MTDADLSLGDIAALNNISLETLTLFLARPDIRQRIHNLQSAIADPTRLLATDRLPTVVKALGRIVATYNWEANNLTINPTDRAGLEQHRQSAETTRRAGALLLRLARFQAGPSVQRASRPPRAPRSTEPTVQPSLQDILNQINELDPTLLSAIAPDEPGARARPPVVDQLLDTDDAEDAQDAADDLADDLADDQADIDEDALLDIDPYPDIPTDQLLHEARLAAAEHFRARANTGPAP